MADKHILIGFGGTGGKILKAFRQRLWTEYVDSERKKLPIGFIYVDTDRAMVDGVSDVTYETIHGNCSFEENDFVDIKTHSNIDAIFRQPGSYPRLQGLLGNVSETQTAVCPVGAAADQKRRAGRILFAANIDSYLSKLHSMVQHVNQVEVQGKLNIYIFAGLAGGTGSGSIVDAVCQTRKWLFENNFNENQFNIIAFCQLPENTPPANWDSGNYKANGYGALMELNNLFSSHYNLEWAGKTCTPPYDVTSTVDYGRMYLSYDNPTPDSVREGAIPLELKIAGGLILYSNKNDVGYTVTKPVELAQLVANFVYTWIFMPGGENRDDFGRFVYFENISGFRDEYDETANPELGNPIPVRTRAIGSFGIKRVVVPEAALQEHIAYTLGMSALLQFKYGNWSANTGYRAEPKPVAAKAYVKDEGRRESWKLSRPFFLLQRYILDGDGQEGWKEGDYKTTYWDACIDAWKKVARGAKNEFPKLIELCRAGYDSGFRGKGVEQFFNDKADAIKDSYSKVIMDQVEGYFFEQWQLGREPLTTLEEYASALYSEIRNEALQFTEQLIPEKEQQVKATEQQIQSIVSDYLNSGAIVRAAIFNNRFQKVVELSKTLYSQKTELAAMRLFAQPLCQELEQRFSDLSNRVTDFKNQTDDLIKFTKERMAALADLSLIGDNEDPDGTENMTLPVIEFYNRRRLLNLELRLLSDQDKMDEIGLLVRNAIVDALQGDKRFSNVQRMNAKVLSLSLLGPVYEKIKSYHDILCAEPKNKILGMPILERLYQKYGSNPAELRAFAKDVVAASGVFAEIDMNEIQKTTDNTPPAVLGRQIYLKRILINLPESTEPELVAFCEDLKQAIEGALPGGGGGSIKVDTHNPNQNEVSILTLLNGFPMRAISATKMLQAEYNKLIVRDQKNRIVLLSEGRDGDFRSLFARPPKSADDIREEVAPELILGLGLEKILRDEASEEWGVGEKGYFGDATVAPWGHRNFTDIAFDDKLIKEKRTLIAKTCAEGLAEAFADVDITVRSMVEDKKKEIQQSIMNKMGAIIKAENPKKPKPYKDFEKWTMAAVALVMGYNPNAQ